MIGILQGRLMQTTNGQLQCFPSRNWREEFRLASECGLECMELLFEAVYNPLNPLYFEGGVSEINKVSKETGLKISSVCADYFMQKPFWGADSNSVMESKKTFSELVLKCRQIGASQLVLPFFEKAELKTAKDWEGLGDSLPELAKVAKKHSITIALEITSPAEDINGFLDSLDCKNVGVCFDTGNATGKGLDAAEEIRKLGERITHVHVKDRRKLDYRNVLLGTGDADFRSVFSAFIGIDYEGAYILETDRGEDPVHTAKAHRKFVLGHLLGGSS